MRLQAARVGLIAAGLAPTSEAAAYRAAWPSDATASRNGLLDTMIRKLKADGIWAKHDLFYLPACHVSGAKNINLVAPASFVSVDNSSPVFSTDSHVRGDGVAAYVATGFIPATHCVQATQNDACVWYFQSSASGSGAPWGARQSSSGTSGMHLHYQTSQVQGRINATADITTAGTFSAIGFVAMTRNNNTTCDVYVDKTAIATATASASTALMTTKDLRIGSINMTSPSFSSRRVAACGVCSHLTSTQVGDLYDALYMYMHTLGVL